MDSDDARALFWALLFGSSTLEAATAVARAEASDDPRREAELIAAWRAHSDAAALADDRLEVRARGLEALQSFGRALAQARTLDELLNQAAESLQELFELDAVAFACALPERSRVDVHAARPLDTEEASRLAACASHGLLPDETPLTPQRSTRGFDAFKGARGPWSREDVLVVPVPRRGRDAMRVAVLPTARANERALGLLLGASNHLALQLDRVLAVAEAEQGRFRAILDSMPHAVVLVDGCFRIVQANASAGRLLAGWPGVSEALRSVGDLDLVSLAYEILAGRRGEAEGEAVLEDGTRLEVSIASWRDRAGQADGLVVVLFDVTSAHRLRAQIAQSEKLSTLGRLIAGVAHEINNPLTAVIGYAQLLRSSPAGAGAEQRLDTIRREAERCRRIVQNLLRFARSHTPERRPFSLNEVAQGVGALLAYPVRAAGSRIELDLAAGLPAVVGDEHAIEQALVNLVTNAEQSVAAAGRAGTITIRTFCDDTARPVLEVEDDGPGIPEDLRARVFDPFFTTKAAGQGTGLGLWLVGNAVAAQGGRVEALPGARGGALLRVTFAPGVAPPDLESVEADSFPDGPRISARILVLDSETALAGLICDALSGEGHATVAAHDASAALDKLAQDRFDLVVSDATLPGLPGDRLAGEMERLHPGMRGRILLTTGDWVSREPETLARRVGAGLLRKPFEIEELRRVVRKQLARVPES